MVSITTNDRVKHILSIAISIGSLIFITFIYWTAPRSVGEVATKGEIALGTYKIDQAEFDLGLNAFQRDAFDEARTKFGLADPEKRDANTQFYIAYSYYREGWGRLSSDADLFNAGIGAVDRVIALDPNFISNDPTLVMKTPYELRSELVEGTKVTISDFNPMRLTRQRK